MRRSTTVMVTTCLTLLAILWILLVAYIAENLK